MTSWFNPRVAVVALSIVVLTQVSKVGDSWSQTIRRDCITCAVMALLYALAFIVPLWRTLGFTPVVWTALTLFAAWIAVAFALISDALPQTLAQRMEHRFNWAMAACCVAGSAAFLLFFQSASHNLRLREEILEARHSRS